MKTKILSRFIIYLNLTFFIAFLLGCEKDYDNVIETQNSSVTALSVSPTDSIKYNVIDSLITIKIRFKDIPNIKSVFCDLYDVDNQKLNSSHITLFDNGEISYGDSIVNDGNFANRFPLSTYYPNGKYYINYFIIDQLDQTRPVAVANFIFNNGQPNKTPFISDAILADSINVSTNFVFSVLAQDSNGYKDLRRVYFQLYRPDSTIVNDGTGNTKFLMYDNGDYNGRGDQIQGDGIFSFKNSFSNTAQKGFWRFEFEAEDRAGLISNKITKSIKVL